MNNNTHGNDETYPGCYVPSHTQSDICVQTLSGFASETDCTICTRELSRYYEITVPIPTARKENLAIYVQDHVATITACRENQDEKKVTVGAQDDLEVFFKKIIKFPEDTDADYLHAVYIKGVLHIFIAKSKKLCEAQHHAVAVY